MNTSLSVGIDITSLAYNRGVSRYTANLVRALAARRTISLHLFGVGWSQAQALQHQSQRLLGTTNSSSISPHTVTIKHMPLELHTWLWRHTSFAPVSAQLPSIDVFHSWDWVQPPDKNVPLVSTIHDLAILKYPDSAHPDVLAHHQDSWKKLRKVNANIITVSHTSKRDICNYLGFAENKVHVIYEALPVETSAVSASLTKEKTEALVQKYQLNKPYILFVGTREPRKNLDRLIKAWQPLADSVDLVIAGASGWDELEVTGKKPRLLGSVSDELLAVLYAKAELLAYPSLDEGFGLPILEAFHYGTPVLTSNRSAMKEVAGNAAELVDPDSIESITQGLENILKESVTEQQARKQRMTIRLHVFNWAEAAKQTSEVYSLATRTQS